MGIYVNLNYQKLFRYLNIVQNWSVKKPVQRSNNRYLEIFLLTPFTPSCIVHLFASFLPPAISIPCPSQPILCYHFQFFKTGGLCYWISLHTFCKWQPLYLYMPIIKWKTVNLKLFYLASIVHWCVNGR
jgi:hypothetical protein